MKINVKTIQGTHFVMLVNPQDKVADLKKNIEAARGADLYPAAQQILIHLGKALNDATTLEENKVVEGHYVVIVLRKNKVSSSGASTASSLSSDLAAQPQSSFRPTTSSTSRPPTSTVGQGNPIPGKFHVSGHATSKLDPGSNLESSIQHILKIGGGNWDRDTVIRAIQAASNNPEKAVEYLYTGIPEQDDVPEVVRPPMTGEAENSSIQAPQPAVSTTGPNTNPLNLFPKRITSEDARLDILRNNPNFQKLKATLRAKPELLLPILLNLEKSNPRLLQIVQEHREELLDLINEPLKDENVRSQAMGITPEENEAIQRLEDLGFDRDVVVEVFFACGKNEDVAASYLLTTYDSEYEED